MERLQNALHRAREKRNASGDVSPSRSAGGKAVTTPRGRATAGQGDAAVSEKWASLTSFQPNPTVLQRNRIVSFGRSSPTTSYDIMRTKLVQQAKAKGWRRIAITSPTPRCGKTTTALNLGFSLSRHEGMRTFVIELDLRRPAIARCLGLTQPLYFAKALAGQEPPEDHLICHAENLALGTNITAAANPSELLQSATTRACIDYLEATYQPDLLLFDTAPLLASDDTIGALEYMDAALLMAAAEMTTIADIDVAESEIAEVTEVMGVVLNKCRYAGGGYGYDYDYSYG